MVLFLFTDIENAFVLFCSFSIVTEKIQNDQMKQWKYIIDFDSSVVWRESAWKKTKQNKTVGISQTRRAR